MLSIPKCYFYLVCAFLKFLLGVQSHTTNVQPIHYFILYVIPAFFGLENFTFRLWDSNPGAHASTLPCLILILLHPKYSFLLFYCTSYNFQTYFLSCGNTCAENWAGSSSLFYTNHWQKLRDWWISLTTEYKNGFNTISSKQNVSCSIIILKGC